MRTGKDFTNDGESLVVMPWPQFRWLATDDLKAIYAYLAVIPAVANATAADVKDGFTGPPTAFPDTFVDGDVERPLPPETDFTGAPVPDPGHVLRGLAIHPLADPASLVTMSGSELAAFGRGAYLAQVGDCNSCHTSPDRDLAPGSGFLTINTAGFLSGGTVFRVPPPLQPILHQTRTMSANLTGEVNGVFNEEGFTFASFDTIIQTGQDEETGTPLGFPMPWDVLRNMTIEDLSALYTYVHVVATEEGRTDANDQVHQSPARFCMADTDCDMGAGETCNMDATTGNECVGKNCSVDSDCDVCQTCEGTCTAPASDSACLAAAL
jgi:hypothetical protein